MNPPARLSAYLKPYWKQAAIAPLLMVLEVSMDLLLPRFMQQIVDIGIARRDLPFVLHTGALMTGLALLGAVGGFGCTIYAVRAGMNFGADLRGGVYRKVQFLSFGNLDRLGTGQLVTRLTDDVNQVQDAVLMLLRILVRAPLLVVGSVVMAILTSPRLALLLLVLLPLLGLVLVLVIGRSFPLYTRLQGRLDRLNVVIQENLAGVRVVKAFVRAPYEQQRFGAANESLTQSAVEAMQLSAIVGPFMLLALNFGVAATIWFGGLGTMAGTTTAGEIIAFVNYLRLTLFSLLMVSTLLIRLSRAQASAGRLAEVLESRPDVQDRPHVPAVFQPRGRVAFEHVTFAYDAGEPVLQDITFTAEPGETVAILGATGSGKSSLVHLIPRFYDVADGRVTIDGADVRDLPQEGLRNAVSIALQDPVLFTGSVYDNIRQGRENASQSEVEAAARAAQAHDFIVALPGGYAAQVGQRGVNFSGGQKQRIAIARALVRQPAILILDDSTSAVDVETEVRIQEALETLMQGRTSFVVAQRISTVLHADRILVLDGGRLVAQGKHRELLACSALYREIYESQLGNGNPATRARMGQNVAS